VPRYERNDSFTNKVKEIELDTQRLDLLQKSNRVTVTTDSFEMLRQTVFTLVWEGPSTEDLVPLEGVSLVYCFNRCGIQGVRSIYLLSGWFS
jgi:hypothetical protein